LAAQGKGPEHEQREREQSWADRHGEM
jgi:hypothetical protein